MPDLAPALTTFIEAVNHSPVTWMLVGSMATRLQGARDIHPGDVDILIQPDTDDAPLWELATRLCTPVPGATPGGSDLAQFRSTVDQPLVRDGAWTFGRWHVKGGKLEVARIREQLDAGLLENQGRLTWRHRRFVTWQGYDVPVVPIEVQWATINERQQHERMHAIAAGDVRSWDERLARQALTDRGLSGAQYRAVPDFCC